MHRSSTRAALAVLATLTFAASAAGTAHAQDVTLPGCYGVPPAAVCDVTVSGPDPGADPQVCVRWTGADGGPASHCHPEGPLPDELVPWPVQDAIDTAMDALYDNVISQIDPPCPVIGWAAPGVPGVVDVTPEGDVTLWDDRVLDCPPYATS